MRHLERLPEPDILILKKAEWTTNFIKSGKARPDSSKYAHKDIVQDLCSISAQKCFYCETLLKGESKEVDHWIEVSVDKTKTFEWKNLNLACSNCNDKLKHTTIPVELALDPFTHSDTEIGGHLTFHNNSIRPKHNSSIGRITIKKYRLNTELLDNNRAQELVLFMLVLDAVSQKGLPASEQDKEIICSFANPTKQFSLMFESLLKRIRPEWLEKLVQQEQ